MMVSFKLASSMLLFESVFSFLLKMQMKHMVYSVTLVCDRLTCCRFWEKQLAQFRNCLVIALSSVTRGFINHVIVCCRCFFFVYCNFSCDLSCFSFAASLFSAQAKKLNKSQRYAF